MTILLTGASGFIGRCVLRALLRDGRDVVAVSRRPPDVAGARWIDADLLQPGAAAAVIEAVRPGQLLHFAWNATPGQFWTAPDNWDWAAATVALHEAFATSGGRRAVYAGSCAEYDWNMPELDEVAGPLNPATLYGASKAEAWSTIASSARSSGVSVTWGRIFFLYGPGEASGRLVSDVVAAVLQGRPIDCSDGRQERDFMHVEDVARAFVALLDSDVNGAVNVASGTCRPVRDVLLEIGKQTGCTELIRLGARPSGTEPPRLAATIGQLRDRVGFTPAFDLHDGIADTIAWRRSG